MISRHVPSARRVILKYTLQPQYTQRHLHQGRHCRSEHDSPKHDAEAGEISDIEWELRAGRAYTLLKETLPTFFVTGLVERTSDDEMTPSIYSPKVQLQYTPPSTLPVPLPIPHTLHIEGLPLYHASSVFVRHSLGMFYTNLRVELTSCRILPCDAKAGNVSTSSQITSSNRPERRFTIGLEVLGTSRIGGGLKEWDVLSTYHISPISGLIFKHVVESIQPAPHSSIYATLGAAFGKFAGVRNAEPDPVPDVRTSQVDTHHTKPIS